MIMKSTFLIRSLVSLAVLGVALPALAVSPAEVRKQLAAGQPVTLVDIRPQAAFQAGHIPNAINIPAPLVAQKQLPPLGRVVVYDDGLGPDTATAAAATLNAKPGIEASPLEGGFAAWETAPSAATTRAAGLTSEELPLITFDRLKHAETNNVVLVDLRKPTTARRTALAQSAATQPPLSDLASEFPHARIVKSATVPTASQFASASAAPPLLVLIDNGDGSAREAARALKANGVKRFAILVGGEEMIARQGQAGLNRQGSSIVVQPSPATTTSK